MLRFAERKLGWSPEERVDAKLKNNMANKVSEKKKKRNQGHWKFCFFFWPSLISYLGGKCVVRQQVKSRITLSREADWVRLWKIGWARKKEGSFDTLASCIQAMSIFQSPNFWAHHVAHHQRFSSEKYSQINVTFQENIFVKTYISAYLKFPN